jgi:tetratricopeptide (TPR) repeat protein
MAKRQRQLNKNLVAGLTVLTMVITVVFVAVVTVNAARRDPAKIAEKASALEADGKLEAAAQLYMRAYNEKKQPVYLVDAARCAYNLGEIGFAINTLRRAHAQEPENVEVLSAILERYWELRQQSGVWSDMRDYAETVLELEPDNLLALVSRAMALGSLQQQDPSLADPAEEALARVVELDRTDPRVVEIRVRKLVVAASAQARAYAHDDQPDRAKETLDQAREESGELFREAIAQHPKAALLYINFAQTLIDEEQFAEADQVFSTALAELPDNAKIQYSFAAYQQRRATALVTEDPEQAAECVKAGLAAVDRTIAIEPATYDAYTLRAILTQLDATLKGVWEPDPLPTQIEILDGLEAALVDTVGLRSSTAVTGRENRARMVAGAFDRAYEYHQLTRGNAEARQKLLSYIESFRERARDEYGESVMVPLVDGQYAILQGDTRGAIQAFTDAEG